MYSRSKEELDLGLNRCISIVLLIILRYDDSSPAWFLARTILNYPAKYMILRDEIPWRSSDFLPWKITMYLNIFKKKRMSRYSCLYTYLNRFKNTYVITTLFYFSRPYNTGGTSWFWFRQYRCLFAWQCHVKLPVCITNTGYRGSLVDWQDYYFGRNAWLQHLDKQRKTVFNTYHRQCDTCSFRAL